MNKKRTSILPSINSSVTYGTKLYLTIEKLINHVLVTLYFSNNLVFMVIIILRIDSEDDTIRR